MTKTSESFGENDRSDHSRRISRMSARIPSAKPLLTGREFRSLFAAQRATDRAALLAQLGITEEQAKLLLG